MRNLKKVLALALALVMTLSVMSFASAAHAGTSYTDDDSITDYDEAIQVLTQLGIFKGGDGNEFDANATITREQAAAILYRVYTGDVNDESVELTAGTYMAAKFTDVVEGAWYTGYVGYCYNKGLMKGYDNGKFGIGDNLTGFQMLVMVLRAIGYDQEGEFTGADWELQAASKGYKDGITTTLRGVALSSEISRGAVAELMFRAVVKTQTVSYNKTTGYTKNNATIAGSIFNLAGTQAVANAIKSGVAVNDANVVNLITRSTTAAYDKYGAPYYSWYLPDDNNGNAVTVDYYLNPVATYTNAVTEETLFADAVAAGATTASATTISIAKGVLFTDGEPSGTATTVTKTTKTELTGTGKGVLTELYVLDDNSAAVAIINTYVGIVGQAYKEDTTASKTDTPLTLTSASSVSGNTETIDYPAVGGAVTQADVNSAYATLDGISKDSVVLYNKYYAGTTDTFSIDYTTIRTAKSADVTVTNSYRPSANATDVVKSYFMVGTTKYEYSATYGATTDDNSGVAANASIDAILDREELIAAGEARQLVYFDDYGFVIYTTPWTGSSNATGYMMVTSGTYYGRVADNQYVVSYSGYTSDGAAITVKGGNGVSYYDSADNAKAYNDAGTGLYYYEIDSAGLYAMTKITNARVAGEVVNKSLSGDVNAGDPDALDGTGANLLDDNTVFIVAKYNANGVITGYDKYVGIKNIPDMKDAGLYGTNGNPVGYGVEYVTVVDKDDAIDLVYIYGAKQTADSVGTATTDNVFYLLDTTPEKEYDNYDRHSVIKSGASTTMDFAKYLILANDGTTVNKAAGFYTVDETTNGYASKISAATSVTATWKADGVLYAGTSGEYIVMASNCVVYNVNDKTNTVSTLTTDQIETISGKTAFVAAKDAYGFATVIYVLNVI